MTKSDLIKNKSGKIVSKKRSLFAKKTGNLRGWTTAVQKARKALASRASLRSRRAQLSTKRPGNSTSERISTYRGFSSGRGDVYALRAPSLWIV